MEPLAGAVFKFKKVGGSFEKEYTTDESGEIRLDELDTGAYKVTEIKAPDGYIIDNAERTVQVNGNEFAAFVFTDTKKPELTVTKIDADTGEKLSGAVIRITNLSGSFTTDKTTDKNGEIHLENLDER